MNWVSGLLPKYEYSYFDQYHQLQTKELNIFQCLFRKVFGWYEETHFARVIDKAYDVTLNDEFSVNSDKKCQQLLKLMKKANRFNEAGSFYKWLPVCPLPEKRELKIGVRYNIAQPENQADHYRISSIGFRVTFSNSLRTYAFHDLSITEDKTHRLKVRLLSNVFGEWTYDLSSHSVKLNLQDEEPTIISNLLSKALNDSCNSRSNKLKQFHYHGTDYRWTLWRPRLLDSEDPGRLNDLQDAAMDQLGWKLAEDGEPRQRSYLLKQEGAAKQQNLLTSLGVTQQISLNFATTFLA